MVFQQYHLFSTCRHVLDLSEDRRGGSPRRHHVDRRHRVPPPVAGRDLIEGALQSRVLSGPGRTGPTSRKGPPSGGAHAVLSWSTNRGWMPFGT